MKFGFCTGMNNCGALRSAGYDFIELGVGEVLPGEDEERFIDKKKEFEKLSLPSLAFNIFIPGRFSIIKSYLEGDREVLEYAKTAIQRVAEVGGRIIVLGSGGARRCPEGIPQDKALEALCQFARDCGAYAEEYGVTIAIEHLNRKETNILNTTQEAVDLVERVNHPNVMLLVDTYHMRMEAEDIEALRDKSHLIAHVHVADGEDRSYPHKDMEFYRGLCSILKEAGYQGGISVECRVQDFDKDMRKALEVIREVFA